MGNISLKRVAGEALASYIASNIPGLASVSAAQSGPEEAYDTPTARLIPEVLTFEPTQYQEIYENATTDDGKLVLDVGQFTGVYTLQLWTKSKVEREQFEQAILDLFLADAWSPGTLYVNTPNLTITGYTSLYSAEIKARLDTEEWREEMAFQSHRFVFIDILVDFPALVAVNAKNLVSLQVCLADVNSNIASINDIDSDYRVEIGNDGTTTRGTI
jgi:hypothetical protein